MGRLFFSVFLVISLLSCGGEKSGNDYPEQKIVSTYVVQNISNYDVYISYELLKPASEKHPEVIHPGERIELFNISTGLGLNSQADLFKSYELSAFPYGTKVILTTLRNVNNWWKEDKIDSSNYLFSIVLTNEGIINIAKQD